MGDDTERSFDDFFRSVYARLVGQAYLLTGSQAAAQDLAQEALARAWTRWSRVSALENPEGWVRRVLHNLAVSHLRWHGRRRSWTAVPPGPLVVEGPGVEAMTMAAALRTLPPKRRRALVLHDVAGVPVDDIADELGVAAGTVRSWLSRDRAALAEHLGAESREEARTDE